VRIVELVPGDGGSRPSPAEMTTRGLREFPPPFAVACGIAPGTTALVGFQGENGRPYAMHVTYRLDGERKLLVRNKPAPQPPDPENPPPFVTVDTLWNAFGIYGRGGVAGPPPRGLPREEHAAWFDRKHREMMQKHSEFEEMPRSAASVLIDGLAVPGSRVDYPDCSGVELDWDGRTVQCVGPADLIDKLELRSAEEDDLDAFVARTSR